MEARNPDDIMAECLLRGGKMLSKACRTCGSPLFEVKGETLCVVCREKGEAAGEQKEVHGETALPTAPAGGAVAGMAGEGGTTGEGTPARAGDTEVERELRQSIAALARRAREETDPERCRALMEAARAGALALSFLQR